MKKIKGNIKMNRKLNFLEYILDFCFFLLLYFCKPFAKVVVDIFYPIISYIIKDIDILSIVIFFIPLILFIIVNKFIINLIQKKYK